MKTESQNTFTDIAKSCTLLAGRKKEGSQSGWANGRIDGLIGDSWKGGRKEASKEGRVENREMNAMELRWKGRKKGRKVWREGGNMEGRWREEEIRDKKE